MDFIKYCNLLLTSSLYFSRLDRMGDPYEGRLTKVSYEKIVAINKAAKDGSENFNVKEWIDRSRQSYFANCWHASEQESAAMWGLYGMKGQVVAIQSEFSALCQQLPHFVFAGPVLYLNEKEDDAYFRGNAYLDSIALWKRRSFSHEREVRFFFSNSNPILDSTCIIGRADGFGFQIRVNVPKIVKAVYVDPTASDVVFETVKALTAKFGINVAVNKSDLLCDPIY